MKVTSVDQSLALQWFLFPEISPEALDAALTPIFTSLNDSVPSSTAASIYGRILSSALRHATPAAIFQPDSASGAGLVFIASSAAAAACAAAAAAAFLLAI